MGGFFAEEKETKDMKASFRATVYQILAKRALNYRTTSEFITGRKPFSVSPCSIIGAGRFKSASMKITKTYYAVKLCQ